MKRHLTISTIGALLLISAAHAELAVSPIFREHAVLQRDKALAIWGTADPGSKVSVRIGNLCNHALRPMPVPQFRSDDWPYPEAAFGDQNTHRRLLNAAKKEAQAMTEKRLEQEARQLLEER